MASVQYEENFGRTKAEKDGNEKPSSLDHIYKDTEGPKDIYLVAQQVSRLPPDQRHWLIAYPMHESKNYNRIIQLTQEKRSKHYTNWGPLTKATSLHDTKMIPLVLKSTLAERKKWDAIAHGHPVQVVDGVFNCQIWIRQLLDVAVSRGLVSRAAVDAAIGQAERP
ncbi:hypothetical protein QCA50_019272 [Cerrena zonata]|uniref:Uncharacterized protein n=1 Tax=Cerrena zonata TaxID=2478898 RepID=A0AAW0FF74_9APHY